MMALMWLDGAWCFTFPRTARWTVHVLDRNTGEFLPMPDVRFRYRRSAYAWIAGWAMPRLPPGVWVQHAVVPLVARKED